MSHQDIPLRFSEDTLKDVEGLAKNLNISVERVIAQAIALLKLVQGRKVILKDEKQTVEVNNYTNLPPKVDIKT